MRSLREYIRKLMWKLSHYLARCSDCGGIDQIDFYKGVGWLCDNCASRMVKLEKKRYDKF